MPEMFTIFSATTVGHYLSKLIKLRIINKKNQFVIKNSKFNFKKLEKGKADHYWKQWRRLH